MNYQSLIEQSEKCMQLALFYMKKKELDLVLFYYNANVGFKKKARALRVKEAL